MRKSSLVLVLLAASILFCGCQQGVGVRAAVTPRRTPQKVVGVDSATYRLRDKELEPRGLEEFWWGRIPIRQGEKLVDAYVLGDHIIMESQMKRLFAIDRASGVPTLMVDLPYRCDFRGAEDDANIYVPCRNILIAVDKRGFIAYRKFLKFAPGGIPVANDTHVFVPCLDGRMRSFLKESGYFDRQYTTKGELEAKPSLGTRYVYAGSNDGFVYAFSLDGLELAWTYKTFGAIRAGLVYSKPDVFVGSTDGSLYRLNGNPQGTPETQLAWHRPYATGDAVDEAPYVGKTIVLVVNRKRECHAVDRKTGRRKWMLPNVDKILTQGRLNTYLLQGKSRILAVGNKTGVVRWHLDTVPGAFRFFLVNPMDDTIYLVKPSGETQAIRERPVRKPTPAPAPAPAPAP